MVNCVMGFISNHMGLVRFILIIALSVLANVIICKLIKRYQYTRKHILIYSFLITLLFIYLFVFDGSTQLRDKTTLPSITINVISNYVVVILGVAVFFIERHLENLVEDEGKLSEDYDELAEKYDEENLIERAKDAQHEPIYYPVVNVGNCNIHIYGDNRPLQLDQIKIYDSLDMYELPRIIENNFLEIMSAHDTSVVYNNKNIRVTKMEVEKNVLTLNTERTMYFYSLVTNRAPDFEWGKMTVRDLYERGPKLQTLESSNLSNHLGYNGFVESSDGYIVFVNRSAVVSIGKRTYGDSIGASLKTKYALDEDGNFDAKGLVNAILEEIEDELKIQPEYLDQINIIAAYRDAVECGKPQLLFYAKANKSAEEISRDFYIVLDKKEQEDKKSASKKKTKKVDRKLRKKQQEEQKVIEDGVKHIWIRGRELIKATFEEQGMRVPVESTILCYKREYVSTGILHRRKRRHSDKDTLVIKQGRRNNRFLPMVPSASASVIMLNQYFKKYEKKKT